MRSGMSAGWNRLSVDRTPLPHDDHVRVASQSQLSLWEVCHELPHVRLPQYDDTVGENTELLDEACVILDRVLGLGLTCPLEMLGYAAEVYLTL